MTNYLRPDELASNSEIERSQERDRKLKKGVKTAVGVGTAALGASAIGGLSSKIIPFLSEYIPENLAMKGINKVAPKVGDFLKRGMENGLDIKSGLNYLKENLGFGSKAATAPQEQNIIAQYDDKLHSFIEEQINQGRAPLEAGAIARSSGKFNKAITQMEKDHKSNFSSIIESVYGQQEQQQPMQQAQQMSQQQMQPQQQGQGPGAQALMALADKLSKM
jgi:hypothetical protein